MIDVCLYAEGTYPFRLGGVSSAIHGIMESLPGIRFGVVHIHWGELPTRPAYSPLPNHIWTRTVRVSGFIPATGELRQIKWPRAKVHHSHTCGLAGLAAVVARQQQPGSRMILSEHSLYARDVTDALEGTGLSVHEAFAANEIPPMPCGGGSALRETVLSNARKVYAGADMVTHLTERLRDTAISLGLDMAKSVILPNAIDGRTYRIRHVPRDAKTRPPQLVLLGRVVPVKGVTAAIECARHLHSTGFPFHLRIIGPRDEVPCYAARCERMARDFRLSEFVKFFPPMPPHRALLGADFLLLPSLSEAMPMVVLEAMAAGVPVIATDVGNVMEMLGVGTGEPAGIVTSHTKFANAIVELSQDDSAREAMVYNGPARVASYHDMRVVASRWARIYSASGTSPDIFTKSALAAERRPPITN